jgi:general secretion pathway protein D
MAGVFGFAGAYDVQDDRVLEASQGVDSAYREALIFYQKGCYDRAREKLNYVLAVLNTDSSLRQWREGKGYKPTRVDAENLLAKIGTKPPSESCIKTAVPAADSNLTSMLSESASARAKETAEKEARLKQLQDEAQKAAKQRELERTQLVRKLELERQTAVTQRKKEIEERERKLKLEIESARKEADRKAREAQLQLKQKEEERRLQIAEIQKRTEMEAQKQRALLDAQEAQRIKDVERLKKDAERLAKLDAERAAREERMEQLRQEQMRKEEMLAAREEDLLRQREDKMQKRRAEIEQMEEEYRLQEKEDALRERRRLAKDERTVTPRSAPATKTDDRQRRLQALLAEQDALLDDDGAEIAEVYEGRQERGVALAADDVDAAMKAHDEAEKMRRVDALWQVSKRLYNEGMYDEAIKGFERVVSLEGNPRTKYTSEAKRFIEQAREKKLAAQEQQARGVLKTDIVHTEDTMIREVYETQIPPYVDPPKKIEKQSVTPLIETPIIRRKLQEKRVTMDFDKVGLKSVVKFLSQESGVNFVASQKVLNLDPTVTARFDDANIIEVIKYLTKSLGLVYRIDKEIVWIADPEEVANEAMETRVYYLLRGGGLFTDFTPVSGGSTGLGGSSAQINKIYTIEDTLKEVVAWPADAKLTYDKRLNALIARNTPQNLQMLEEMLYSLDIEPVQVLIEARFIEIDITDTKDFGIELKLNDDFAFDKEDGNFAQGLAANSGFDFTSFTRASEGLNFTYKGVLTYPQFQVVLHALEETKRIKTLSSPRITTLNSQMASIKVVDEWIYPTRYEFEIVQFDVNGDGDFNDAGETAYQNVPKDFLRRDVGIILKVVPTVGADRKTINLSLIPEVSEATADAFQYSGNVTLPLFTSRNLSTTVVVNSADTVVLGGLVKESRTKTVTKVPLLGSLPVLGNLFKKDSDVVQRKNLMIFVTAKVLSPSGEEIIASGN